MPIEIQFLFNTCNLCRPYQNLPPFILGPSWDFAIEVEAACLPNIPAALFY
jgi:hypothetical protein